MGVGSSSYARRTGQDEGDRDSGGAVSPASFTIEPVPEGLERVVYPKYEEAFRLGLAAFSNHMRTNKFRRQLPHILGTIEFESEPLGGIIPVPTPRNDNGTSNTSTILTSMNGLTTRMPHSAPPQKSNSGSDSCGHDADEESGASANGSVGGEPEKRVAPVPKLKILDSLDTPFGAKSWQGGPTGGTCSVRTSVGALQGQSTSQTDSVVWHSASSGGLIDSPSPDVLEDRGGSIGSSKVHRKGYPPALWGKRTPAQSQSVSPPDAGSLSEKVQAMRRSVDGGVSDQGWGEDAFNVKGGTWGIAEEQEAGGLSGILEVSGNLGPQHNSNSLAGFQGGLFDADDDISAEFRRIGHEIGTGGDHVEEYPVSGVGFNDRKDGQDEFPTVSNELGVGGVALGSEQQ